MGLIKALAGAVGGSLADQWLEVWEADKMSTSTVMTQGVMVRRDDKRGSNRKGTENLLSDGSIIHVYDNQCMILVDGGMIVDYTAEPGYYKVDDSSQPSIFNGQLMDSVKETFDRFRYGGVSPRAQKVYFINLQEIRDIKFGTPAPLGYFDQHYGAEVRLRAFGTYTLKIVDPILFYKNVIGRDQQRAEINEINEQYLNEFIMGLQASINQMSQDGIQVFYLSSRTPELSKYMADALDDTWRELRGMEIMQVAIASISYDEKSQKIIDDFSEAAMYGRNAAAREGFVQTRVARGLEAAGSNEGGATGAFLGLGLGQQAGGGFMGAASASNQAQMQNEQQARQQPQADRWFCTNCGTENQGGKFCSNCGTARATDPTVCPNCGNKLPQTDVNFCPSCGHNLKS